MNILYITYDGLTDFIGQSQILPYLLGCAATGHRFTVISFEKPERRALIGREVEQQCSEAGIIWQPQRFRSRPPYLAKLIDQFVMRRVAIASNAQTRFDLLHCRSYPAAVVGLALKRQSGTPLLFDMRGFWPDQKRDGGRWAANGLLGRMLYARWKAHEARLIGAADHIVSLTDAAQREIERWPAYRGSAISVIPCCADFEHFRVADKKSRQLARQRLGISPDAPVLAYLGSLGTVYMIADHLRLFSAIRRRDGQAKALFIGRDSASDILSIASRHGIQLSADDLRVVHAERDQVPIWLGAADAGTCFIKPCYSSIGVSPTKLAEYLACGIPVIANHSVGDVEPIVRSLNAGYVVTDFSDEQLDAAADAFFGLRSIDRAALRARARQSLDLPNAISAYLNIYDDPRSAVNAAAW